MTPGPACSLAGLWTPAQATRRTRGGNGNRPGSEGRLRNSSLLAREDCALPPPKDGHPKRGRQPGNPGGKERGDQKQGPTPKDKTLRVLPAADTSALQPARRNSDLLPAMLEANQMTDHRMRGQERTDEFLGPIAHVEHGDLISVEWMNRLIDAINDRLPRRCSRCGTGNFGRTTCSQCGAPL